MSLSPVFQRQSCARFFIGIFTSPSGLTGGSDPQSGATDSGLPIEDDAIGGSTMAIRQPAEMWLSSRAWPRNLCIDPSIALALTPCAQSDKSSVEVM